MMIASAPPNFGMLQLTTSNPDALSHLYKRQKTKQPFWEYTHWKNSSKDGKTYLYWSAQAYIIQKSIVAKFISDVIHKRNNTNQYLLINTFYPCRRRYLYPCILSQCMFSDSYIYAGGDPVYISTLPLVTGAKIGFNSTIHQLEVGKHKEGFGFIKTMTKDVIDGIQNACGGRRKSLDGKLTNCEASGIPMFIKTAFIK